MLEYVYPLKLPPLDLIANESFLDKPLAELIKMTSSLHPIEDFLDPQYTTYQQHRLTHFLVFYKNNDKGMIHVDCQPKENKVSWAINWVLSGSGRMDYWDYKTIGKPYVHTSDHGYSIITYGNRYGRTDIPPDKTYHLPIGAYLVNAGVPHLPSGVGQRIVVSTRTFDSSPLSQPLHTWEQIVEDFKDLIIT